MGIFVFDEKRFAAHAKVANGTVQRKLVHRLVAHGATHILQHLTDENSISKALVATFYQRESLEMEMDSRLRFRTSSVDQTESLAQSL